MIKPKMVTSLHQPIDQTDAFRNTMSDILTKLGVEVEYHHNEVATAGQVGFNFKPGRSPVETTDKIISLQILLLG